MKISEVIAAVEAYAPLRLQEEYDNAGLQVGFPDDELTGVLVCLDVTEEVILEAVASGCNLILSHHPLLFHPLRQVSDSTCQQRCVVSALANGLTIYSAHTNLDNARGGVNFKIAGIIGLQSVSWLQPMPGEDAGSGIIGELPEAMDDHSFLAMLKDCFNADCLAHTAASGRMIRKVALCGGAGAFLMHDARRAGADCFITGELHYHDYFESEGMLLAAMGHYESEQFTEELLATIVADAFPLLKVVLTDIDTNPVRYM